MRRALALAAACSALAVAGGCGSSSSKTTPSTAVTQPATGTSTSASTGAAAPGNVKIAYRNIMISPATVTIKAGTSVTWTDFDPSATPHNVAVQSGPQTFTSPTLGMGRTFTFKFFKPGVYNYICTFHPTQMIGKITVAP
jgi:plastocyanin